MRMNLLAFGNRIRRRRRELDITQVRLAERLGWTQAQVSRLESGNYAPNERQIKKLARILGLAVAGNK